MQGRLAQMIARVTGFLISSLVLILAIEASFRFFEPQENLYLYEVGSTGLRNRPGFADRYAMLPKRSLLRLRARLHPDEILGHQPFSAFVRINAQGLRADREFALEKGKAKPRIVVLGDSISFGWPFDPAFSYPSMIEKKLSGSEVINCSVIGANTRFLKSLYEDTCSRFQADLVLLQITLAGARTIPDYLWSDFAGEDARIHDAVWSKTGKTLAPAPAAETRELDKLSLSLGAANPEQRRLIEKTYSPTLPFYEGSHAVRFVENSFLISAMDHAPAVKGVEDFLSRPEIEKKVLENLKAGRHPTLEAIDQIRTLAERSGAKLVVMLVPNLMALKIFGPSPDVPLFLEQLGRRSIPFIDLNSRLKSRGYDDLYLKGDVHPNQMGYEWIADQFIRDLESSEGWPTKR